MAEIVFDRATKRYADGKNAVDALDLAIPDGQFVVLVGPSGCGKSTALRMVAGLEDITAGELRIGGRVANDLAPRERNIAMVFQSYALYPHLTVAENIGFGLRVRGMPASAIAAKVKAAAEMLELDEFLTRKPAQLSGGQRQRVAMGRAIVREPNAFLMDEPLSNLDARLRVQMRAEIGRIQKMTGVTTIYVTHDQVEAMTMGDRVAVMNRGVLQQFAPPRELYDEPANIFVASFIGSPPMNLMEARIEAAGDGPALIIGAQAFALPPTLVARRPALARWAGKTVVAGIRPEDVRAAPDAPDAIQGSVILTEDVGAAILVHLDIEARPPRLNLDGIGLAEDDPDLIGHHRHARLRLALPASSPARAGDTIRVAFDADRLHLFDPATGAAIST